MIRLLSPRADPLFAVLTGAERGWAPPCDQPRRHPGGTPIQRFAPGVRGRCETRTQPFQPHTTWHRPRRWCPHAQRRLPDHPHPRGRTGLRPSLQGLHPARTLLDVPD